MGSLVGPQHQLCQPDLMTWWYVCIIKWCCISTIWVVVNFNIIMTWSVIFFCDLLLLCYDMCSRGSWKYHRLARRTWYDDDMMTGWYDDMMIIWLWPRCSKGSCTCERLARRTWTLVPSHYFSSLCNPDDNSALTDLNHTLMVYFPHCVTRTSIDVSCPLPTLICSV